MASAFFFDRRSPIVLVDRQSAAEQHVAHALDARGRWPSAARTRTRARRACPVRSSGRTRRAAARRGRAGRPACGRAATASARTALLVVIVAVTGRTGGGRSGAAAARLAPSASGRARSDTRPGATRAFARQCRASCAHARGSPSRGWPTLPGLTIRRRSSNAAWLSAFGDDALDAAVPRLAEDERHVGVADQAMAASSKSGRFARAMADVKMYSQVGSRGLPWTSVNGSSTLRQRQQREPRAACRGLIRSAVHSTARRASSLKASVSSSPIAAES